MNRADVYGALARLTLPQEGDPGAADLLRAVPGTEGLEDLLSLTLPQEHERVFGPSLTSSAPPYETCYGTTHVFMQSQQLADLAGFYRAFGLTPPSAERVDHLAVEFEFMQVLVALESKAREEGKAEQADVCLQAQRRFIAEHLGRWTGALAGRLKESGDSPFYARLGEAFARFVAEEAERLDARPVVLSPTDLRLPELETDNACGTCTLAEPE